MPVTEREEWRVLNFAGIPICATRATREEAEAYMNWAKSAEMRLQHRTVRIEQSDWQDAGAR